MVLEIENALRSFFVAHPKGLVAAYLFGSVARGTPRPSSDVDIALLFEADRLQTLDAPGFEFEADLERVLGKPVQVVTLNGAPPDLVHRVLRDGILVLETDRGRRILFEVQARNEFFDLQPFLERYRGMGRTLGLNDPELIAKKLALIETCVAELRSLARPDELGRDIREERFIELKLQIAIQAALDAASHIPSERRLGGATHQPPGGPGWLSTQASHGSGRAR